MYICECLYKNFYPVLSLIERYYIRVFKVQNFLYILFNYLRAFVLFQRLNLPSKRSAISGDANKKNNKNKKNPIIVLNVIKKDT